MTFYSRINIRFGAGFSQEFLLMELYCTNNTFKTFVGAKALKPTHKKKDVGPQFGLGIFLKKIGRIVVQCYPNISMLC